MLKDDLLPGMGRYCERCRTGIVFPPFRPDEVCHPCNIKAMKARWEE